MKRKPSKAILKRNETIDITVKVTKPQKTIRQRRILSGSRINDIGSKKLNKNSSQPLLKNFEGRKA